eukprot:m.39559 g.39559  ORF g.39559 m.39559 type:complete len:293 (-) comp9567_c0_seq1:792-1670(-)
MFSFKCPCGVILLALSGLIRISICGERKLNMYVDIQERSLFGRGLHRNMSTSINFAIEANDKKVFCRYLVLEYLPSASFMDLDQRQTGQYTEILIGKEVSIEAMTELSPNQPVLLYPSIALKLQEDDSSRYSLTWDYWFELHLRYFRARDTGENYVNFTVSSPSIFYSCDNISESQSFELYKRDEVVLAPCLLQDSLDSISNCITKSSSSNWIRANPTISHGDGSVAVTVPVGNLKYAWIITIVTVSITILAAVYVIAVLQYAAGAKGLDDFNYATGNIFLYFMSSSSKKDD